MGNTYGFEDSRHLVPSSALSAIRSIVNDPLYRNIIRFIEEKQLTVAANANAVGDKKTGTVAGVVAGISGGADSVCLLYVLYAYYASQGLTDFLTVVHINHMLRGDESFRDERFTSDLCEALNIPIRVARADVSNLAASSGRSVEEAGRDIRYRELMLDKAALETSTGIEYRVAVAHNRDDLAETVLHNIIRGSGTDGLLGMSAGNETSTLIRPLLFVSRADIEDFLSRHKIPFVKDSTNANTAYTRNRIRSELLPYLRKHFNPGITDSLVRLSTTSSHDREYLFWAAKKAFELCLLPRKNTPWADAEQPTNTLSVRLLSGLDTALSSRVLRIACSSSGAPKNIGLVHISAIQNLVARKHGSGELHLPDGLIVRRSYDELGFFKHTIGSGSHDVSDPCNHAVSDPAQSSPTRSASIGRLKKRFIKNNPVIFEHIKNIGYNSLEQFFDAGSLPCDLVTLRTKRSGDKFFPIKSPGQKKLKEFFIDAKIPAAKRAEIPLLAIEKDIIWVIGFRVGERYKVAETTDRILCVRFIPFPG